MIYDSEYAVYMDKPPFVREVHWGHPDIRAAMTGVAPGWRSLVCYPEWRLVYALEPVPEQPPEAVRNARVRNFIRVLLGEYRDHPTMLAARLRILAGTVFPGPEDLCVLPPDGDLFTKLTVPAYNRLVQAVGAMQRHREADGTRDGLTPPFSHGELSALAAKILRAGAPVLTDEMASAVEASLAEIRERSPESSLYTFRGHTLLHPLWLESTAFCWNARRGARAWTNQSDPRYFLRPFFERYRRSRKVLASFLLFRAEDAQAMARAAEPGGGPILYVTDEDEPNIGIAPYKLFKDRLGCGDEGSLAVDPAVNGNMVPWAVASALESERRGAAGWNAHQIDAPDLGFYAQVPTFSERLARVAAALDRHTNWGPTGFYMLDATAAEAVAANGRVEFLGQYSPFVATSYDLSAADEFARFDAQDPFEAGYPKWLHVVRFSPQAHFGLSELRRGDAMNFDNHYLNESELSHDAYHERGLDRFGWVPESDLGANLYLSYGARGETKPAPVEIPPRG